MTDAELSALEVVAKAATPGPWKIAFNKDIYHVLLDGNHVDVCDNGYDGTGGIQNSKDAAFIAAANPSVVLSLIAELRQTKKERDWVIQNIRPTDVGPTACPTKEIWYNCDEGSKTPRNKDVCHKCWLKAAKEATCQE